MDSPTQNEKPMSVTECLRLLRKAASNEGLTMIGDMGMGRYKPTLTIELWPKLNEEQKEPRRWQ